VKSVELERLTAEGLTLTESRNVYEYMRDRAAEHYAAETGSCWMPRTGSRVSHRNLTSAVVDSREFLAAERRQKNELHCPKGTRIALAGGQDYQDVSRIFAALDKVREKHPDMVLLHGGAPKGAELIAAKWADNRGVAQVVFRPDWNRHNRAAPFKRNDAMLEMMPKGIVAFPGNGITDNLVDKARKLGIKVMRVGA
jgi:hypothetical protein